MRCSVLSLSPNKQILSNSAFIIPHAIPCYMAGATATLLAHVTGAVRVSTLKKYNIQAACERRF
jgi:hypothetical protein